MKRKYFLFRREGVSNLSTTSSDFDDTLSVFGVNADQMSYVTAVDGGVVIFFNDATPLQDSNLSENQSLEKSKITVNCDRGKEFELIESIMNFLGSDNSPSVMRFDSFENKSSIKEVRSSVSLGASVKAKPIDTITGEIVEAGATAEEVFRNSKNGIDFRGEKNLPILDLDSRNATFSGSNVLNGWVNSGTGGATYSWASNGGSAGTPSKTAADAVTDAQTVSFLATNFMSIANTLTVKGDYTIYTAYVNTQGSLGNLYGSASGETSGFTNDSEHPSKSLPTSNTFGVKHENSLGLPAIAKTTGTDNNTVSYVFPNTQDENDDDYQLLYVNIIRRDVDGNLYLYNHKGQIVSFIPAKSGLANPSEDSTLPGDTSGHLVLDQVGSQGSNFSGSFKGRLARFGVITRDVGNDFCVNLAKQLFNLYES